MADYAAANKDDQPPSPPAPAPQPPPTTNLSILGYARVLDDSGIGVIGNFAFGFSEVAVLVSITTLYGSGLKVGGPSGSVWGFLAVWLMNTAVAYSMAEICSAYPSAGSVYHWSAQLVPLRYASLASYCTGWINWVGNASGNAAVAYSFSLFLKAALQASRIPAYSDAAAVIISIGVSWVWTLLNWISVADLAAFNNGAALFHGASLVIIIVVLFATAQPLQSASWVFFDYENLTGFTDDAKEKPLNDKSYVGAMGVLTACYYFSGFEASAHMAEETQGAEINAPNGIISTVFSTGMGGLVYLLALLFATNDFSHIMATDDAAVANSGMTTCAAANVFINSCGWRCGSVLTWMVCINLFFAGISCAAVTGRITFALMRDNAFPFSEYFKQVDPVIRSPVRAINFVAFFVSLLLLLLLNPDGSTAFSNIIGLCTIGFQVSYALPILFKVLYGESRDVDFPANIPRSLGAWSRPLGCVSSVWLCGTSCLFFFPISGPLTLKTNNWLSVVVGGCVLLAVGYWYLGDGKHKFQGPKRVHVDSEDTALPVSTDESSPKPSPDSVSVYEEPETRNPLHEDL